MSGGHGTHLQRGGRTVLRSTVLHSGGIVSNRGIHFLNGLARIGGRDDSTNGTPAFRSANSGRAVQRHHHNPHIYAHRRLSERSASYPSAVPSVFDICIAVLTPCLVH